MAFGEADFVYFSAVEIALDDILDDRREVAVGLLETLVFRDEPLEMMEAPG